MIQANFRKTTDDPKSPPTGFKYIDQGNYVFVPVSNSLGISTIYSDSATSCIIVIAIGSDNSNQPLVSLAHVDSPECINAYVGLLDQKYSCDVTIYAQGANPADNKTAIENANALKAALQAIQLKIIHQELSLQQGDPRKDNRGDYGINFADPSNIVVSNQPYILSLTDRDPTCGGQSIYCIMRRQETPPVQLRDALVPFTLQELVELVKLALVYKKTPNDPTTAFTNIINMQNDDILNLWSSTPQYEAPWFSDQIKQGACFAMSMAPVTQLCEQYLLASTLMYARMIKEIMKNQNG